LRDENSSLDRKTPASPFLIDRPPRVQGGFKKFFKTNPKKGLVLLFAMEMKTKI
jgi:hypothetical protein